MIVVENTRELEEKYDLNLIPDDEPIRVLGGMKDKLKYSNERYKERTTYPARQLKQIIQQMRDIEDTIPEDWNQWQRAKYIYEVLGKNIKYNDEDSYEDQQSSNLTILMSKKGICAGYALTFKEMMDRQGIQCHYIRGKVISRGRDIGRHAWNLLVIDNIKIPVDLTWDSERIQSEQKLCYFGNNIFFAEQHKPDSDEEKFYINVSSISRDFIDQIDTSKIKEVNLEEKKALNEKLNALSFAIGQIYEKFVNEYGENEIRKKIISVIKNYIQQNEIKFFTRQEGVRDNIKKHFENGEMLDLLVKQYVERSLNRKDSPNDILGNSLRQTVLKYNKSQCQGALKEYILNGNVDHFTSQNNARQNIEQYMTRRVCFRNNY